MPEPRITEKNVRQETILASALTSMIDTPSGVPVLELQGAAIQIQSNGKFTSYQDFSKPNPDGPLPKLQQANLDRISVTTPDGNTSYFKKITQKGAKGEKTDTGFKAVAWMETNATGEPLVKDGKANVVIALPGYKGTPTDKTAPTISMHAVGRGELYPPTTEVAAFIKGVKARLDTDPAFALPAGTKTEVGVVAHSMGSANIIPAALALEEQGLKINRVLAVDPVGAKLAEKRVREVFVAKKDGKVADLAPNQQALAGQFTVAPDAAQQKINDIISMTTSVVPVKTVKTKEGEQTLFSRSAMLESYDLDAYTQKMAEAKARNAPETELKAITAAMEKEQAALKSKNFSTILAGKRDGAKRDAGNDAIGTEFRLDVSKTAPEPARFPITAEQADPRHLLPTIIDGLFKDAPITSLKGKDKTASLKFDSKDNIAAAFAEFKGLVMGYADTKPTQAARPDLSGDVKLPSTGPRRV